MPHPTTLSSGRITKALLIGGLVFAVAGCAAPDSENLSSSELRLPPATGSAPAQAEVAPPERLPGVTSNLDIEATEAPLERWAAETSVQQVQITSTADGALQDALWTPPAEADSPLVVLAHSWSMAYDQEEGIPVAVWAESVGWGFIQPDFRGVNDGPDATGSDLTTQDVIDAIDYAIDEGGVDPDRVYITGFSGGGMMSLLATGRFTDRIAGAAAWVPVYDLVSWYSYSQEVQPERAYVEQMTASCGGDPTTDPAAQEECTSRSPSSVMSAIRDAEVPVYLANGVSDTIVPVSDVLRAFNALADEADRIPQDAIDQSSTEGLAPGLSGDISADSRFTDEDPEVLFSRSSGSATVVVFDGGHEFVYYPGLDWLSRLDAAPTS